MCPFPTERQSYVINHRGRLVVVAGPGTGKTKTIVERMKRLLQDNPKRVVSFITFTRTSRRDTDTKLKRALDQKTIEARVEGFPRTSTLHTFAKALVHRYAATYGRDPTFSVLVPKREKSILVSEVIDDLGLAIDPGKLEEAITKFRATGEWPAKFALESAQRREVIQAFESLLKFYNTFDMEGLVGAACQILRGTANNLPQIFLQVDEYQDLNPRDQELVTLASAAGSSQVVVVGDDAQSIYGFRHANPDGIRQLWQSPDWDHVSFQECHRLPPHILLASQALIKGKGYLGAEVALPAKEGKRLLTLRCTRDQQIKAVGWHIRSLLESGRGAGGAPIRYKDFLVLCPTKTQVHQVAAELDKLGIPTKQKRSGLIPDDVWRILLVLRMVKGDSLALRQWLEIGGLSPSAIRLIRRQAISSGHSLYECCSTQDNERVAHIVRSIERIRQALVDPIEFREAVLEFPSLAPGKDATLIADEMVKRLPSVDSMVAYAYERYGVIEAEGESDDMPDEDKVLVTTMHSAKGLESEFVFITWLNATFLPFSGRDVAQEERVFYVALTRARQDVILTFQETYDAKGRRYLKKDEAMSPFLRSISDYLDIQRVTASHLKAQSSVRGRPCYARAP